MRKQQTYMHDNTMKPHRVSTVPVFLITPWNTGRF